ncbi:MAG: electron transport complex subunit RsxE, partial [Oscillospiraceae bacterium]
GLAATFVLICSNIAISALRKVIPNQVRIPAYITIVAGFVSVVQMLVSAYMPDLNKALGIYLPLIVVNCIILGRAEMFASKNKVIDSALDGLGMGIGFTIVLTIMGTIREVLGAGTCFGLQILPESITPMGILVSPPGGFFIFGCLMALAAWFDYKVSGKRIIKELGCKGCPSAGKCNLGDDEKTEGACE